MSMSTPDPDLKSDAEANAAEKAESAQADDAQSDTTAGGAADQSSDAYTERADGTPV